MAAMGDNVIEPSIPVEELRKFNVFQGLILKSREDEELLKKVKIAYVFGQTGLLVLTDDQVYSTGRLNGVTLDVQLGLVKVEELCGKGICNFFAGENNWCFAFGEEACQETGKEATATLYYWGVNYCIARAERDIIKPMATFGYQGGQDKKDRLPVVAYIECVLTSLDRSISFTINLGNISERCFDLLLNGTELSHFDMTTGDSVLRKVASFASERKFVVVDKEKVLCIKISGSGPEVNYKIERELCLCPTLIPCLKMVAGQSHYLVLSEDGKIASFGENGSGQLGNGTLTRSNNLSIIPFAERVLDIAADVKSNLSVCQTSKGIFVWGGIWGEAVVSPIETSFKTMQDAFTAYSQLTYKPIRATDFALENGCSLAKDTDRIWSIREIRDVEFSFPAENESRIYADPLVLQIRSAHFRRLFDPSNNLIDRSNQVIPITSCSRIVFQAFLDYFNTDKIELPETDFENIFKLMQFAQSCVESTIVEKCKGILIKHMSTDSAVYLVKNCSLISDVEKVLTQVGSQFLLKKGEVQKLIDAMEKE